MQQPLIFSTSHHSSCLSVFFLHWALSLWHDLAMDFLLLHPSCLGAHGVNSVLVDKISNSAFVGLHLPALNVTHATIMCCLCSSSLLGHRSKFHRVEFRRLPLGSVRSTRRTNVATSENDRTCEKFCTRANVKNEASGIMHDSKEVSVQQMFNVETPKIPYGN